MLDTWDTAVSLDLHQHFGIDLLDEHTLQRPWWWLRVRLYGLLDIHDSRLGRWVTEASK